MWHEDLMSRIEAEFSKNKHLRLAEASEVKAGQIRQIKDKDLLSESRLALILGVNKLGRNCEVALVNGLGDFATSRDFEVSFADSSATFTIFAEFQGNVDLDQVEVPTLIGSICEICSREINVMKKNQDMQTSVALPSHGCFKWGSHPLAPLSRMSDFRQEEYFQFYTLLNKFEDFNKFLESREFQYFYSKQGSISNMIESISQKFPDIDERRELLNQIRKNPRQLAVLRGR
jgi:hypothetical protein